VRNTGETVVRSLLASALSLLVFLVACSGRMSSQTGSGGSVAYIPTGDVQHVVVIFGENVSFDHYFGTYPVAVNKPGEPRIYCGGWHASAGRPKRYVAHSAPKCHESRQWRYGYQPISS
jgi:phospholipase C